MDPDQVLYRAYKGADDSPLNAVLRQTPRAELIIPHCDDINGLAASCQDGLVRPSLVIATLQALQRHNPLHQAIQELGCLTKTRPSWSNSTNRQRVHGTA